MPKVGQYWVSMELYYTREHTWARIERDGKVTVGVDDFASKTAGEIMALQMATVGSEVEQMKVFGQIESSKCIAELYSPFSGRILAANQEAVNDPHLLNQDPYGAGWLIVIQPARFNEELMNLLQGEAAIEWLTQVERATKN